MQQVQGTEEGLTAVERQEWQAAQEANPTLFSVGQWVDAGVHPARALWCVKDFKQTATKVLLGWLQAGHRTVCALL